MRLTKKTIIRRRLESFSKMKMGACQLRNSKAFSEVLM